MFNNLLEVFGPIAIKVFAVAACLAVFVPLLAAFAGFVGPVFG